MNRNDAERALLNEQLDNRWTTAVFTHEEATHSDKIEALSWIRERRSEALMLIREADEAHLKRDYSALYQNLSLRLVRMQYGRHQSTGSGLRVLFLAAMLLAMEEPMDFAEVDRIANEVNAFEEAEFASVSAPIAA